MSLASELLHSTSKRRDRDNSQDRQIDPVQRLFTLDHVVYGLISEHEPPADTEKRLRADLRIILLSGLIREGGEGVVTRVCRQAAAVMAELIRVLPRCRE
jgi:hypothetical protein